MISVESDSCMLHPSTPWALKCPLLTFWLVAGKGLALLKDEERLERGRRVHDQRRDLDGGEDELDGEVADVVGEVVGRHVARVLQREAGVLRVAEGLQYLGASL